MAAEYWEAGKEIYKLMKSLVSGIEDHHHLVDVQDDIAIVMKDQKPPKDPTVVVVTGKTSKAPAVMAALGRANYKFIITLSAREWKEFTPEQQKAQIDHCLCAMATKYNEKTDTYTYSIRKPEVIGYSGEFKRNGVWREFPGADSGPSPVEELFGDGENE